VSELHQAGVDLAPDRFLIVKIAAGGAAMLVTAVVALFIPIGPAFILAAAYLGWVAPTLVVADRGRHARVEAHRATIVLVERVDALVAAGRPAETALGRVIERSTGAALLDATLRRGSAVPHARSARA
jgi:hypothetical protein